MSLKKAHFVVGAVGVIVFLGTGLYMMLVYHGLKGIAPLPRMLFRSAHIYILLTSLINLALGFNFPVGNGQERRTIRVIASILILIAPILMTTAFFVEPGLASFERPLAGPG